MKRIFIILLVAISLQGCLKIEDDASECETLPEKPVIVTGSSSSSFYTTLGSTVQFSVQNPLPTSYLYIWKGPNNFSDTGYSISFIADNIQMQGEYSVTVVEKGYGSKCASPPASVNMYIDVILPSCGMSTNTFKPGSSYVPLQSTYNGSGIQYVDYYNAHWSIGFATLSVYFANEPPLGTHYYDLTSTSSQYLTSTQAKVYFDNSGSSYYLSTQGGLYTINDGTVCQVLFCNAKFATGSQTLTGGAGNLNFNP